MLAVPSHSGLRRRQDLVGGLTKALLSTGALTPHGRTLVQIWMPTMVTEGEGSTVTLATKGLPFSLIGPGDTLAAFRCLSCAYTFTTDRCQLTRMGAPGRVFSTGEVETCDNLQQCNANIYLRVRDATACGVTSTVLLPIFCSPRRRNPVAVLEINQFNDAPTNYSRIFDWARTHLEEQDLYLPRNLAASTFEMQSHAISIQYVSSCNSTLGSILTSTPSADGLADTVVAPRQGAPRELPRMLNDEEGEAESVLQPQSRVLQPQPRILQIQAPASGSAGIPHPEPEDAVPTGHRHVRTATAGDGAIVAAPRRAARASEVCSADEEEGGEASAMGVDGSEPSLKRACRGHGMATLRTREPWRSAGDPGDGNGASRQDDPTGRTVDRPSVPRDTDAPPEVPQRTNDQPCVTEGCGDAPSVPGRKTEDDCG